MTQSEFTDQDQILADLLKELEQAANPKRVMDRFAASRPELAAEFRQIVGLNELLNRAEPTPPDAEPPRQHGEYLIIRRIGSDGMGEIYEAYHERLERQVAIKIIRRGWTSEESRQRFLREQLVLAKLHQTHIVPIHTAGEHDGVQYFAMPYIRGASLNYVVRAARELHSTRSGQTAPSVGHLAGSQTFAESPNTAKKPPAPTETSESIDAVPTMCFSREYHVSV